jgi:hypothetical protein
MYNVVEYCEKSWDKSVQFRSNYSGEGWQGYSTRAMTAEERIAKTGNGTVHEASKKNSITGRADAGRAERFRVYRTPNK